MKNRFLVSILLSLALLAPVQAANPFKSKPAAPVAATATVAVPFIPSFETVGVFSPLSNNPQPANSRYFATDETAKTVLEKFGAASVELAPAINNLGGQYILLVGPFKGQGAVYRMLYFPKGTLLKNNKDEVIGSVQAEFRVNAGVLADYYIRNPEAEFPAQHSFYGYPPVPYTYLSPAESGVWSLLLQLAQAAQAQATADAEAKK